MSECRSLFCISSDVLTLLSRFVDRDMFMRFLGGGVGHKATNPFTASMAREARGSTATANDNAAEPSANNDENDNDAGIDSDDDDLEAEEMDYGYRSDTSEEDEEEEEEEEDNLGGEDGEEPWEMDDVQAEGFDEM